MIIAIKAFYIRSMFKYFCKFATDDRRSIQGIFAGYLMGILLT